MWQNAAIQTESDYMTLKAVKKPDSAIISYLLTAVAPLCWAGNIVLARGVTEIIPPISFAFWRWAVAFLILLPFAMRQVVRDWPLFLKHWKIMLFLSLTGISGFNTLLYTAMHTTTAINGSLIQTCMPAVILIISIFAFKDHFEIIHYLGVTICIVGACMVIFKGSVHALLSLSLATGDILMLIAVVLYALYTAYMRKRPAAMHPLSFMVYSFAVGAMGLVPLYVWEIRNVGVFSLSTDVIMSILYVSLFPSIAAYFCWNRGIATIGANRTGLFVNLIPVFASLMAVAFLGEAFRWYHLTGMAMIAGGMVMFNR